MAEYNMQELNLPGEDGKRILYPRMKLYGQVNLETITEKIAYASSFTRGDIIGLVQAITDEIAYQMGQGYSVKIDNLGVFTPALGLRQDRERETGEEGDTKRNAVSICLKDIHFKVDKELLYRTARHCHLKRSTDKFQRSSQVFSPQERLERAKKYNVPTLVFNRSELRDPEKMLHQLQADGIDFIILAGFLWLMPACITAAFPNRIINIHPALLPAYGGKGMYGHHVHEAVIAAGEKESGITIHYVNDHYDQGAIIFQAKCPVLPTDTPDDLAARVHELEYRYFPQIIEETILKQEV